MDITRIPIGRSHLAECGTALHLLQILEWAILPAVDSSLGPSFNPDKMLREGQGMAFNGQAVPCPLVKVRICKSGAGGRARLYFGL